jgi:E3 ubiquitin-protein ligase DOA10
MDARCYICLEDEGDDVLYDVCACKNGVHTECLVRWIEQTKRVDCTICTQPFAGVRVHRKSSRTLSAVLEVLLMFVLFAFLWSATLHMLMLSSFDNCVICAILALWCFLYQCALAKIVFSTSYSGVEQTTICTDGLRDMSLRV